MQRLKCCSSRPGMDRDGSLMSELCVKNDPGNCEQEHRVASTVMMSGETESEHTQWTDEKHSLYLKSMEASFVNQLYGSLDTLGGLSCQEYPSEPNSSSRMQDGITTPGQFKVFKDGSWARVDFSNFRREMPRPKNVEKSDHILTNPWIKHYRSSGTHQKRISPSHQGQAPACTIVESSAFQFGDQDSIASTAEVTDQNFVDEVREEEKPSRIHRQKCRKISASAGLSTDQVVPFAKLSLIDNIVKIHGSPKNE